MATVDEIKITGKKYRVWNAINEWWERISYWTAASDVEFEDGKNAEEKVTEIDETLTERLNEFEEEVTEDIEQLQQDAILKSELTFTLSGSTLYITKTY